MEHPSLVRLLGSRYLTQGSGRAELGLGSAARTAMSVMPAVACDVPRPGLSAARGLHPGPDDAKGVADRALQPRWSPVLLLVVLLSGAGTVSLSLCGGWWRRHLADTSGSCGGFHLAPPCSVARPERLSTSCSARLDRPGCPKWTCRAFHASFRQPLFQDEVDEGGPNGRKPAQFSHRNGGRSLRDRRCRSSAKCSASCRPPTFIRDAAGHDA